MCGHYLFYRFGKQNFSKIDNIWFLMFHIYNFNDYVVVFVSFSANVVIFVFFPWRFLRKLPLFFFFEAILTEKENLCYKPEMVQS